MKEENVFPVGINLRHMLELHPESVTMVAWEPSGKLIASGSWDKMIRVFDEQTGDIVKILRGHSSPVWSITWSVDGQQLASGSNESSIRLWDLSTGKEIGKLECKSGSNSNVAWSPKGNKLAVGTNGGLIHIFNTNDWRQLRIYDGHAGSVTDLCWSPNGELLAASFVNGVRVWNIKQEELLWREDVMGPDPNSVDFAPNSKLLAAAYGDAIIKLWDATGGTLKGILSGHTKTVVDAKFSYDSRLIASKALDGTVRLWDSSSYQEKLVLEEPGSTFGGAGIAFHPKSPILATLGRSDTIVRVWDLDIDKILSRPGSKVTKVLASHHSVSVRIPITGESKENTSPAQQLKVFLCHASNDKAIVRSLYKKLLSVGADPWLDEEKLLPGADWEFEIRRAVRDSHVVMICLSRNSLTKEGFVHKEIRFALNTAEEKPEGTIYIIPVKLEPCAVPESMRRWHWVNYYEERGVERLLGSLRARSSSLGLAPIK